MTDKPDPTPEEFSLMLDKLALDMRVPSKPRSVQAACLDAYRRLREERDRKADDVAMLNTGIDALRAENERLAAAEVAEHEAICAREHWEDKYERVLRERDEARTTVCALAIAHGPVTLSK